MVCSSFGCKNYQDKIGVLLAQLGTPEAPTAAALKPYLRQFLSDPRVIEVNRALWWVILNLVVLTTRPKRSARLYKRIWSAEGSPLLVITKKQTLAMREYLQKLDRSIEVEYGMRYGNPSIESALDNLMAKGCSRILLFPMYPQYSASTTASTYDVVFEHLLKRRWVPTLRVAEPYYRHPAYVEAQAAVINDYVAKLERPVERLVLSYHGIPQSYVQKGDPYCCMCTETTRALVPELKIPAEQVIHTYQSRFGKDPWLTPYTDETIDGLAKQGIKRIAVALPGFTADCLETLDEMGNEARKLFMEHGGEELHLIPCLNDSPAWLAALGGLLKSEIGSWLDSNSGTRNGKVQLNCPVKFAAVIGD